MLTNFISDSLFTNLDSERCFQKMVNCTEISVKFTEILCCHSFNSWTQ